MRTVPVGNTFVAEVYSVRNNVTGVVDLGANLQATLVSVRTGAEVGGVVWPIQLDYVADSAGRYQGTVDASAELIPGELYEMQITGVGSDGEEIAILETYRAARRRARG